MSISSLTTKTLAVVAAAALTCALTGCSGGNKGGDTTCGAYSGMSSSARKAAVEEMLKDHGSDASNGEITLTMASVSLYCSTIGNDDSPIGNVYTG